jgi:hypothetical protein
MAFTEDLSDFINDDTPGYVLATIGGVAVGGIFDNGYAESFDVDGTQPSLTCASADVSTAVRGTAVVVNAVSYTVADHKPDGTGMTKLVLEKV